MFKENKSSLEQVQDPKGRKCKKFRLYFDLVDEPQKILRFSNKSKTRKEGYSTA